MKFSESWLREWVNPPISTQALADQLTMAGLEVDSIEPAGAEFTQVVVGHVVEIAPHPNAEKLRVCTVDVGGDAPVQIVCGAPNVHVGMKSPTALVGATLPGGLKIKRAKLRGVESVGMLCSSRELQLADDADGLMPLPPSSIPGMPLKQALKLDDRVIDIDLTPNRGDCLCIAGIAREVGVLNRMNPTSLPVVPVDAQCDVTFPVEIVAPEGCPRYAGRVIRGVDPAAATPTWMTERLRRAGIRSLGPLVDVTNYVMLELGQPMHAFDLARLSGGIVVRWARAGESLTLLDGTRLDLEPDVLIIADHTGPLAMAGIMGGEASGCDDGTRNVFLESAFFAPAAIIGKARRHGLHTESSHRFERGVDSEHQVRGLERATDLLVSIAGGEPGPVTVVEERGQLPSHQPIRLRSTRVERLLGLRLEGQVVEDILRRLDLEVEPGVGEWQVIPPSFRFDISMEDDLIEEVGRVHGYGALPSRRPLVGLGIGERTEADLAPHRVKSLLVDRGFHEVITYSFVSPELQAALDPDQPPIPLANPISSDLSVMRTSLLPGLVSALQQNLARQQSRLRLFETGLVFRNTDDGLHQTAKLGALVCGDANGEQWGLAARPVDFYDLKGDLQALLDIGGRRDAFAFERADHPALHPGRSARILVDGGPVGWIGGLHPDVERRLDLGRSVYVLEVDLSAVMQARVPTFSELSRFPAIRRDLALLVDESVSSEQVLNCIREIDSDLIRDTRFFDVYRGPGVDAGLKSLAMGLIVQADSRTLTDEQVERLIQRVVEHLGARLGATLRK